MLRRYRPLFVVMAALAVLLATAATASADHTQTARYKVEIRNLTDNQPFTPPVVATHRSAIEIFDVGDPASFELKEVAENGNLDPLVGALTESRHVADVVVAVTEAGPLLPGTAVTFEITSRRGADRLSFASMLICTNDGFTGVDSLHLPRAMRQSTAAVAFAYDAGTEINTEYLGDIVPPCPLLSGVDSGVDGTGASNPDLAEGGVIHHHMGIAGLPGDDQLSRTDHGWAVDRPVVWIEVTRVG